MKKPCAPYLGAAYYPEDWPEDQQEPDLASMEECGVNVVRIAEFAWSSMEPEEGKYTFGWLHDIIEKLGKRGIAVILGTPTCTPPLWITGKHPDIFTVMSNGSQMRHGARRHACPNNETYRKYCGKIVKKMALEFGHDKNVIGWQIDNEMIPSQPRGCFCPVCQKKFRERLKKKFGTIENLNRSWGLKLWSMEYNSFDEIPAPRADMWHHPSLIQEWEEFQSDSYIEYSDLQADILHQYASQPVGTDMMPTFGINYYKISRKLDMMQFNHYNNEKNLWQAAFWMDYIRPIKEKPFWNTETSTCWGGSSYARFGYQQRGFCTVNSLLPYALGSEANLYWVWRSHWSGQEMMHGSVLATCGRPLHIFDEVKNISRLCEKARGFLTETKPKKTGIGLHVSCSNALMFDSQQIIEEFSYKNELLQSFYHPILHCQLRPDLLEPSLPLDGYRVVVTPFLLNLDEGGLRERIENWVKDGGTWIVGPLTDIRTREGTKYTDSPFGSLEKFAGIYCKYSIPCYQQDPFPAQWNDGSTLASHSWFDGFELKGAQGLAFYTDRANELSGLAAVTSKKVGKGRVIVLGSILSEESLQKLLLTVCGEEGVRPAAEATSNILAVPRSGNDRDGLFVLELDHAAGKLNLPAPMVNLDDGKIYKGEVAIPPYGVMILQALKKEEREKAGIN